MDLGRLDFTDGQKADIHSIHISSSYASLLEGAPTQKLNGEIMDQHAKDAKRIFWGRTARIVEPLIMPNQRGNPSLPPCCIMAELLSYQPAKDLKRMMSFAILLWYQTDAHPLVGETIVSWAARTRWSEIAEDGDW